MTLKLEPGQSIAARYQLVEQVGMGASGEVWKATDRSRTVAIKFMNSDLLMSPDAVRHRNRFQHEINALNILSQSPHVPPLYAYDLNYERPYFVMHYIDAPSYAHLVSTGEMMMLTLRRRLKLLDVIGQTITYIHARGIIHRDIKPGNIHGTYHPYLIDFSVSLLKSEAHRADPGLGTQLYMPPNTSDPPSEFTDNFGFAMVSYEILFGQHAILSMEDATESLTQIRAIMRERIQSKSWNLPSRLSDAELPGSLRGADLDRLDKIFHDVFSAETIRYHDLRLFMSDLRNAILVSANEPYLDYVPDVLTPRGEIPKSKDYTIHEVNRSSRATNHGVYRYSRRLGRRGQRGLRVAIVVLLIVWAVLMILLLLIRYT